MRRILPLLLLLLAAFAAPLHARELVIEDFDVAVVVQADGSTLVTETLRVRFTGSWNGILRNLSLEHRTAEGKRRRLRIDGVAVTDAAGKPMEYETEGGGWMRTLRIRVPGAEDATRTVVIRYRVANALRYYRSAEEGGEEFDELYWNATGNDWEIPIEASRVRVTLPAGVEPTRFAAYGGYAGSNDGQVEVTADGGVVTARALRSYYPREGLTVAVGWAPGAVAVIDDAPGTLAMTFPVLLPILAFLLMFSRWRKDGRDPAKRAVAVQYAPPEGLTPTETGTLVDHRVQMHDITATLVDLAVRGYVHVEERQESRLLGLMKNTEYTFHLAPSASGWSELKTHERRFLQGLARCGTPGKAPAWARPAAAGTGGGQGGEPDGWGGTTGWKSVKFSDLSERFYTDLSGIKDAVYEALVARGYYRRRPDQVVAGWMALGMFLLMGSVFVGFWIEESFWLGMSGLAVGAGGVLSSFFVFGFGAVMAARTEAGARAMEAALGFKEFLAKVESPRYRLMITSPEMFERYLPYAMAFQVEGRWAKAFEGMYREPPGWYHGSGGGFAPTSFATSMRGMSVAAGSAMSSSPSSSGSGGGGSSGGGSGGGGGGGW